MALPRIPCTHALVLVFLLRLTASMRVVPHDLFETRSAHTAKSMVAGTGASARAKPTADSLSEHSGGRPEESVVSDSSETRQRAPTRAEAPTSVTVQKPSVASLSQHSVNRSAVASLSERSAKVSEKVESKKTQAGHAEHNHSVSELPECSQDSSGHATGCRKSCKCGWTHQCYTKWVPTIASPSRVDEGVCSLSMTAIIVSACGLFLAVLCFLVTVRMSLQSSVDEELQRNVVDAASPKNDSANVLVISKTTSAKLEDGSDTPSRT